MTTLLFRDLSTMSAEPGAQIQDRAASQLRLDGAFWPLERCTLL